MDNHRKDDRLKLSIGRGTRTSQLLPGAATTAPTSDHLQLEGPDAGWQQLVEQELALFDLLPSSSPLHPLKFINNPLTSGEYREPMDPRNVNAGIHSLDTKSRANAAFLTTELRLAYLLTKAAQLAYPYDPQLLPQLRSQWDRLNRDKELHWLNQRKMEDKSYVNTGTCTRTRSQSFRD